MGPWIEVFGRLHPAVLHVPIGLLLGLGGVELWALVRGRPRPKELTAVLVWLGAVGAALAAGTGYVLSLEGGYNDATATWHLRWGLLVAGATLAAALLHDRAAGLRAYRLMLILAVAAIFPAGHLGGTLTHGRNFITEPLDRRDVTQSPPREGSGESLAPPTLLGSADGSSAASDGGAVPTGSNNFVAVIQPIFAARCVSCHGETRTKGHLALHTAESVQRGGESGPVFVAGRPDESEIIRRLRLPEDDHDHMPPSNKPQPSPAEIDAIAGWITAGAPFGTPSGAVTTQAGAQAIDPSRPASPDDSGAATGPDADPAEAPAGASAKAGAHPSAQDDAPASPPPREALESLAGMLVHVEPIAADSNELLLDFAAPAAQIGDEQIVALLMPLRENVADLSLARTGLTDAALTVVAECPRLRRLDLRQTRISDVGLVVIARLPRLEELVLARTELTDGAVDTLVAMSSLKRVFVWESGLSNDAVARLRSGRPELRVDNGDEPDSAPSETEQVVQLGKPATPAESLKPINTTCPVLGKPVDPRYAIIFEGKVIGFCCPNCPSQFWAEPSRFRVTPGP